MEQSEVFQLPGKLDKETKKSRRKGRKRCRREGYQRSHVGEEGNGGRSGLPCGAARMGGEGA